MIDENKASESGEVEETETELLTELSQDDKPSGKEHFLSGFYTGVIAALSTIMVVLIIVVIVADKRIAFIDTDSTRYEYAKTNEKVSEDIVNIAGKIQYIAAVISEYYLEDVDEQQMIEGIYAGMVASLEDVYSAYLPVELYDNLVMESEGYYSGIGCGVKENKNNEIEVESVADDSPSKEAGIKPGDVFIEIEGVSLKDKTVDDVISMIRGDEGTKVKFKLRLTDGSIKEFELERKSQEFQTVNYEILEDNIGYVYIAEFEKNTVEQFDHAIDYLEKENVDGIIIDLRGNPGGTLYSVSAIADRILPKGLVVYTEDKNGKQLDKVESTDEEKIDLPLVVLVDENSASASEVLAGAIKDREAGTLVGKTTFGKGIVQSLISMDDGSAIKLTTAKYYTPNGNYIHGIGIKPDIEVDFDGDKYYNEEIDTQLEKAIEVLKEKI